MWEKGWKKSVVVTVVFFWKFWNLEIYRISEFFILENYGINYNSKKGRYNPVVVGSVVVGNH